MRDEQLLERGDRADHRHLDVIGREPRHHELHCHLRRARVRVGARVWARARARARVRVRRARVVESTRAEI